MRKSLAGLLPAIFLFMGAAQARVTRVVIENRESPAYKGQSFKDAGAYERLANQRTRDTHIQAWKPQ